MLWSGQDDTVDLMAGTDILRYTGTTRRLQQTYKELGMFAHGVPPDQLWILSPTSAGLQYLARHVRT
eukprot:10084936-Prorocentrum_lima.AAC.1